MQDWYVHKLPIDITGEMRMDFDIYEKNSLYQDESSKLTNFISSNKLWPSH